MVASGEEDMVTQLALPAEVYHAQSAELLQQLSAGLQAGGVHVDATLLERIDFGPLQVLLAAALAAKQRDLPFSFAPIPEDHPIWPRLKAHAMQGVFAPFFAPNLPQNNDPRTA
jgi:hypothetical protein